MVMAGDLENVSHIFPEQLQKPFFLGYQPPKSSNQRLADTRETDKIPPPSTAIHNERLKSLGYYGFKACDSCPSPLVNNGPASALPYDFSNPVG
jgi:hypothetical protein